ncbi:MAG: Bax inhibitor-1/YccA family protein, partial [Candidatus Dependentiae bacterium]
MFNDNHDYRTSQPMARGFMQKVFAWMTVGLSISAGIAYYFSPEVNPLLFRRLATGPLWFLLIVQFGLVMYYSFNWQKLSTTTSAGIFITYSALSGVTLAPITYIYTQASLIQTFVVAAGLFAMMAIYGWVTNHDLSQYGSMLTMGLFGLILAMFANWFFQSSQFDLMISCVGVLLFTVLTAYDIQKLKYISRYHADDPEMHGRLALMGALHLYLD